MKLILLDKDGTLVNSTDPSGFITKPGQQIIIPGALKRVRELVEEGAILCVVSNQGGVEKDFKRLEDVFAEMQYCEKLYRQAIGDMGWKNIFSSLYFCPDFSGNNCWNWHEYGVGWTNCGVSVASEELGVIGKFRKPNPGMLKMAIWQYQNIANLEGLDITMIGDRSEDEQAAQAAGVNFINAVDWHQKSP